MAASTTHHHDWAQTANGMVCSLCGATLSQAETAANKAAGFDNAGAMSQYIHKKIKG